MRRLIKVLAGLLLACVVLVAVLLLSFDAIVKRLIVTLATERTGCPVSIERLNLGLRRGTLHVEGFTIGNPPGYGDLPLLSLPELYLAYDLDAAATNALRFKEVRVNLDRLSMVINEQGRTNLTDIAATLDRAGLTKDPTTQTNLLGGMSWGGIDRLQVSLGQVSFADLRQPSLNRNLTMGITNRALTNVVSPVQLVPLGLEIMLKTAMQLNSIR